MFLLRGMGLAVGGGVSPPANSELCFKLELFFGALKIMKHNHENFKNKSYLTVNRYLSLKTARSMVR